MTSQALPVPTMVTITVTRVIETGNKEQPLAISYDGDGGKPYKPGLSMRRVLVYFWGKEGGEYVGRQLTLYRDPDVIFGKLKVGGIRISHMSHLGRDKEMALATTKGAKRRYEVQPLVQRQDAQQQAKRTLEQMVDDYIAGLANAADLASLLTYQQHPGVVKLLDKVKAAGGPLHDRVVEANSQRAAELSPAGDDEGEDDGQGGDDGFPANPDAEVVE